VVNTFWIVANKINAIHVASVNNSKNTEGQELTQSILTAALTQT